MLHFHHPPIQLKTTILHSSLPSACYWSALFPPFLALPPQMNPTTG
ncbi:hypothetical protein SAMN04515618_101610 [Collimonas sp. OK307]|nr:hypothetical protein SAMN04515618_101610 [Collimonas sp. OK307]